MESINVINCTKPNVYMTSVYLKDAFSSISNGNPKYRRGEEKYTQLSNLH